MDVITTTQELAEACARLGKHPYVTVDTEFLRESTYFPILCVAQMASPDEALVIDTRAEGIDLAPFFALMADERVLKVFHAARQDIEIVWHQANLIPHPIFDTQVAAMVLGYGDSISYDQLVQRITGDSLDKSHRFTDWSRRPLSPAQVKYAISDVTHLRDVFVALDADLHKRGRAEWVGEEMEAVGLAMQRALDKTENMKARADAVQELEAAGTFEDLTQLGTGEDDIDRQLKQLSSSSEVDSELAKMKAELGAGSGAAGELGAGDTPAGRAAAQQQAGPTQGQVP